MIISIAMIAISRILHNAPLLLPHAQIMKLNRNQKVAFDIKTIRQFMKQYRIEWKQKRENMKQISNMLNTAQQKYFTHVQWAKQSASEARMLYSGYKKMLKDARLNHEPAERIAWLKAQVEDAKGGQDRYKQAIIDINNTLQREVDEIEGSQLYALAQKKIRVKLPPKLHSIKSKLTRILPRRGKKSDDNDKNASGQGGAGSNYQQTVQETEKDGVIKRVYDEKFARNLFGRGDVIGGLGGVEAEAQAAGALAWV